MDKKMDPAASVHDPKTLDKMLATFPESEVAQMENDCLILQADNHANIIELTGCSLRYRRFLVASLVLLVITGALWQPSWPVSQNSLLLGFVFFAVGMIGYLIQIHLALKKAHRLQDQLANWHEALRRRLQA